VLRYLNSNLAVADLDVLFAFEVQGSARLPVAAPQAQNTFVSTGHDLLVISVERLDAERRPEDLVWRCVPNGGVPFGLCLICGAVERDGQLPAETALLVLDIHRHLSGQGINSP